MAQILLDYLISSSGFSATEAATHLDSHFKQVCAHIDGEQRMTFLNANSFLAAFWQTVFTIARHAPYHDPKQDELIQIIVELRKLPVAQCEIDGEMFEICINEPVFGVVSQNFRMANYPTDFMEQSGRGSYSSHGQTFTFKEQCDLYLNFSAFQARVLAESVLDNTELRCRDAEQVLHDMMKSRFSGEKRDCIVMAAAQFIILAGHVIVHDFGEEPGFEQLNDKWKRRFCLAYRYGGRDEPICITAGQALQILKSSEPEKPWEDETSEGTLTSLLVVRDLGKVQAKGANKKALVKTEDLGPEKLIRFSDGTTISTKVSVIDQETGKEVEGRLVICDVAAGSDKEQKNRVDGLS